MSRLDADLQARLRGQPWTLDGSEESGVFLAALLALEELTSLGDRETVKADLMALFDAIDAVEWLEGEPGSADRALLTSLLTVYSADLNGRITDINEKTEGTWRPDYDWGRMMVEVLESDLHRVHRSSDGRQVQLIAWGEDLDVAQEVLDTMAEHLGDVEEIAGEYGPSYMLAIVDSAIGEDGFCGSAVWPAHTLVINAPSHCSVEITTAHEMTHLVGPKYGVAIWFSEGLASVVARRVTGHDMAALVDTIRERVPGDLYFMLDFFNYPEEYDYSDEDRVRDISAGDLFLFEFVQLVGYDGLMAAVQNVPYEYEGQDVLDALYQATPPDKQPEVRDLIAKWCRQDENWLTGVEPESPVCAPS